MEKYFIRYFGCNSVYKKNGLAFFGDNESLDNTYNRNFLSIMELLTKFKPFIKAHLNNYRNKGSESINYISYYTVRELIPLLADKSLKNR